MVVKKQPHLPVNLISDLGFSVGLLMSHDLLSVPWASKVNKAGFMIAQLDGSDNLQVLRIFMGPQTANIQVDGNLITASLKLPAGKQPVTGNHTSTP